MKFASLGNQNLSLALVLEISANATRLARRCGELLQILTNNKKNFKLCQIKTKIQKCHNACKQMLPAVLLNVLNAKIIALRLLMRKVELQDFAMQKQMTQE
jgi:hypothetical protein